MDKTLYIVIPCYNEQEVLPVTVPVFMEKLNNLVEKGLCSEKSKVVFVNDENKITKIAHYEKHGQLY